MIHSFEEAVQALQSASYRLFEGAKAETGCQLNEDETRALAGALRNLMQAATVVTRAERN